MAPVKKIQIRTKYTAWLSESTKTKIIDRDRAQDAAIKSGSVGDWSRYKRLRNDLTKVLHSEKMSLQQAKLQGCEENLDSGKLCKNILG